MTTRLLTPPAGEPVSLAEAKSHCRVTHADEDALISLYISAAREQCEHILSRSLMLQSWELMLDSFPSDGDIELIHPPVASVTSVQYVDEVSGQMVTLNANQYVLDKASEPAWIMQASGVTWPATNSVANAVRIVYQAGYADAASVPMAIKQWILLAVGVFYKNREAMVENTNMQLPRDFNAGLLDRYRIWQL